MSSKSITESPQYTRLAEQIGSFIEYWGFKQVHGKIWTLIFLSPEPVDANFLKDTLKISKALTSMSLKDLLHYNVVREVEKDKPGTQKYCVNPNITQVILDILNNRELSMLQDIEASCVQLGKVIAKDEDNLISKKRMEKLTTMVTTAHLLLREMCLGSNVDFKVFDEVMSVDS